MPADFFRSNLISHADTMRWVDNEFALSKGIYVSRRGLYGCCYNSAVRHCVSDHHDRRRVLPIYLDVHQI